MKTVDIKGKNYVMVNERIMFFRENFEGWSLESEIVSLTDDRVVIKGIIKNQEGRIIATGTAFEEQQSSFINKTSYIENCETSAWGRALGNLGIGVDASMATADEVANAIVQQETMKKKVDETEVQALEELIKNANVNKDDVLKWLKVNSFEELNKEQYHKAVKELRKRRTE